jgi:hypothetical protein
MIKLFKNLTSLFALFVFLFCRVTSGAFTIDSSTPTSTRNFNEHPILWFDKLIKLRHTLTETKASVRPIDHHTYYFCS